MTARRHRFSGPLCASLLAGGLAVGLAAGLAACSSTAPLNASDRPIPAGSGAAPGFSLFPDLPIPRGAEMDVGRSLVLGSRDDWIGRLAIKSSGGANKLFDFYNREMPRFGWSEITSVRAEISVLTFARDERVATIQIRGRTIAGADVDVTISPRGRHSPRVGTAEAR